MSFFCTFAAKINNKYAMRKVIILMMGCLIPLMGFSKSVPKVQGKLRHTTVLNNGKGGKGSRPRCPSRQRIECYCEDSGIYIRFGIPEGDATLKVFDGQGNMVVYHRFDTSMPLELSVSDDVELEKVEIITSSGNEYEGVFEY